MHAARDPQSPRELNPPFDLPPTPPPVPVNANLQRVLLLNSGGLLLMFDRDVIVDSGLPPTTWAFNGNASIQSGAINFPLSSYIIINGFANSGDPVVLGADDPGARTTDGGYVNGVTMVVSDL